jgi:hypothetical protein
MHWQYTRFDITMPAEKQTESYKRISALACLSENE